ncbi:MAG: hydroxyacid dehydrogenase, partial [Bacteroidales bacterium]|nr:hydroxyacid dehydrogenase [Bacteroidales bacterium]
MKIVAVEPIGISPEKAQEIKLEFAAIGHEFVFFPDRREDAESLRDRMRDAEVVVISNIPLKEEVLSACPKLKHIALAFTGKDHIDGAYCAAHGITIRNAAGYAT